MTLLLWNVPKYQNDSITIERTTEGVVSSTTTFTSSMSKLN